MPNRVIPAEMFQKLIVAATAAREKAYSPYSGFAVGAAILLEDGEIVTGCNVENAGYSLTICAERNAMSTAIMLGGGQPVAIAIVGEKGKFCPPCGACRQFLVEFNPKMIVVLEDRTEIITYVLEDLLPEYFSRKGKE